MSPRKQSPKLTLQIGALNMHGLNEHKLSDDSFVHMLESLDILIMTETWLSSDININDYYSYSKIKHKRVAKGRPSGGITLVMRPDIRKGMTIVDDSSDMFLWFKLNKSYFSLSNDIYVCAMYIPPESSTSHKCDPFDILEHKIVDL